MSSKFWADASDDSDASSSHSSSSSSGEEQGGQGGRQFRFDFESSSDDDEQDRTVRTLKDRRFDAMHEMIARIHNAIKIDDWVGVSTEYAVLEKELNERARAIVKKEGIPRFYLKYFLQLEEAVDGAWAEKKNKKKKRSKLNAKALTKMRQTLRKRTAELEDELEAYKENPLLTDEEEDGADESESEESEEEESESEEESSDEAKSDDEEDGDVSSGSEFSAAGDDGDDASDEDTESESDSDVELDSNQITRDYWVKKAPASPKKTTKGRGKGKGKGKNRTRTQGAKKDKDDDGVRVQIKGPQREDISKLKLTPQVVINKLTELRTMVGRRGTNRVHLLEDLNLLADRATDPTAQLKVLTVLVSALLESNVHSGDHLSTDVWQQALTTGTRVVELVQSHPKLRLTEDDEMEEALNLPESKENEAGQAQQAAASEDKPAEPKKADEAPEEEKEHVVLGNVLSICSRLHLEFVKSLRSIGPHTTEYVPRLKDEAKLVDFFKLAQQYYADIGKANLQASVMLLKLEHEYYMYEPTLDALAPEDVRAQADAAAAENVGKMAAFIYKHGDGRERIRALLCHVYHLAVRNEFVQARDLWLMSHVTRTINEADIPTRILFNRTNAQLGLCAFRTGHTKQALNCLTDLCQSNHTRELIAQGITKRKYHERDQEAERLEMQRQYPYHMHMNLDMVEAIHLISAMFVEVPIMAIHGVTWKWVSSRTFRRFYEHHMRQAFHGPPENTRDRIMAATQALLQGEWRECQDHLWQIRMWNLIPNADAIKAKISLKIRKEGLRAYLLTYASHFKSIDLAKLQTMFELDGSAVHKVVAGMINRRRIEGMIDQPTNSIIMSASRPNSLQRTALQYAEKLQVFMEMHERVANPEEGRRRWRNRNNNNNKYRGRGNRNHRS